MSKLRVQWFLLVPFRLPNTNKRHKAHHGSVQIGSARSDRLSAPRVPAGRRCASAARGARTCRRRAPGTPSSPATASGRWRDVPSNAREKKKTQNKEINKERRKGRNRYIIRYTVFDISQSEKKKKKEESTATCFRLLEIFSRLCWLSRWVPFNS